MFSAILILLAMSFTDLSRSRGLQFRPLSKIAFFIFVGNFLILMQLGAEHVESPFIEFGQISTVIYFAHFLIIIPLISLLENSLPELQNDQRIKKDQFVELFREQRRDDIDFKYTLPLRSSLLSSFLFFFKAITNVFPANSSGPGTGTGTGTGKGGNNGDGNGNGHEEPFVEYDGGSHIWCWCRFGKLVPFEDCILYKDCPLLPEGVTIEPKNKRVTWILVSTLFVCSLVLIYIGSAEINVEPSNIYPALFNPDPLSMDAPRPWGIYFQDSATPQMEALVELHNNILFYLVIILFGVGWMLVSIVKSYTNTEAPISHKQLSHGTLIELIWTITPALILILIAFPSFKLLYLMDEVSDPAMAVLAEGHQWYWSYQYPDFLNSDEEFIEFDSYLVPESDLEDGALRMLEVDNRLIIPELTHVRFIVTGADVIHSFACPALGIKCDAYPGRLNQTSVLINREGTFYGQCSEICGILHSSMPIVIESVSIEKFISWIQEQ